MVSPGFSHDFVANNLPNGRYTHYPELHALALGVFAKTFREPRIPGRLAAVGAFCLSLLLWFAFLRSFFGRPIALWTCVFMGLSPIWLDLMDSLCGQPYDELFRSLTLVLGAWLFCEGPSGRSRAWGLAALWLTLFLQAFNSIEFIIPLQVFLLGLVLASEGEIGRKAALAAVLALAPMLSFALHFWQTAVEWGSVSGALSDWSKPFGAFVVGAKSHWHQLGVFGSLVWLPWAASYGKASVAAAAAGAWLLFSRTRAIFLLLCASAFSFYLLLPIQSFRMGAYSAIHGLPVFALCLAAAVEEARRRLAPAASWAAAAALAAALMPLGQLTGYLRAYPNPLWAPVDRVGREITEEDWRRRIERAKWIATATAPGDLVFVPEDAQGFSKDAAGFEELEADPIEEYFAGRHLMPLGDDRRTFERRLSSVLAYVKRFKAKVPELGPERVCFVVDPGLVPGEVSEALRKLSREEASARLPLGSYQSYRFEPGTDGGPKK